MLMLHYCGVAVCVTSPNWDGVQNLWKISQLYGGWISVALIELLVICHLLAFQYARSGIPYRLKFTKAVTSFLCIGLGAGLLFHVLTMRYAEY